MDTEEAIMRLMSGPALRYDGKLGTGRERKEGGVPCG